MWIQANAAPVSTAAETNFWDWAMSIPWYGMVGAVAVLVGGLMAITSMVIAHREKMAGVDRSAN